MRYLTTIALLLVSFSSTCAQDRLSALAGNQQTSDGNNSRILLIFDRQAGLFSYCSQDSRGNIVNKIGEYDYANRKLTTKWWDDNAIEESTLKLLENEDVEYQVLSNSRQPNQKFSAIKLRRAQPPKELATTFIQLGDTYLLKKTSELQQSLRFGQSLMQMQHEFNMKNLEASKEFGRALGQVTIE